MVNNPDVIDPVVEKLYEGLREASTGVGRAIDDVLRVFHKYETMDYGSKVRVLTKALMVVNERHRLQSRRTDELGVP